MHDVIAFERADRQEKRRYGSKGLEEFPEIAFDSVEDVLVIADEIHLVYRDYEMFESK